MFSIPHIVAEDAEAEGKVVSASWGSLAEIFMLSTPVIWVHWLNSALALYNTLVTRFDVGAS